MNHSNLYVICIHMYTLLLQGCCLVVLIMYRLVFIPYEYCDVVVIIIVVVVVVVVFAVVVVVVVVVVPSAGVVVITFVIVL